MRCPTRTSLLQPSSPFRPAPRWLNNRAENSHLPFRRREHAILRFRRMQSLQKFATVHFSVYNHFNQERHLRSRDNFKLNRARRARRVASARGGLIPCRRWRTQTLRLSSDSAGSGHQETFWCSSVSSFSRSASSSHVWRDGATMRRFRALSMRWTRERGRRS